MTTKEKFKTYAGITDTDRDDQITSIVDGVNAAVERYLGRVAPDGADIELASNLMIAGILNRQGNEGMSNASTGGVALTFSDAMTPEVLRMLSPYKKYRV